MELPRKVGRVRGLRQLSFATFRSARRVRCFPTRALSLPPLPPLTPDPPLLPLHRWYRIHNTIRAEICKFGASPAACSGELAQWQVDALSAY